MPNREEYEAWVLAAENDQRVRDFWVRQLRAEGWRIVKLREVDYGPHLGPYMIEEELP